MISLLRLGHWRHLEHRRWMPRIRHLHVRRRSLQLGERTKWCGGWFRLATQFGCDTLSWHRSDCWSYLGNTTRILPLHRSQWNVQSRCQSLADFRTLRRWSSLSRLLVSSLRTRYWHVECLHTYRTLETTTGMDVSLIDSFLSLRETVLHLPMVSLSGNNGNQWTMGALNVNVGAEFYFIIEGEQWEASEMWTDFDSLFQGTHGGNYEGDIAVDDVRVLAGSQCTVPTTTTTLRPTTTLGRHTPLSCDFENGTCRWTDDLTASGKWARRQGQLNGFLVGPHYGMRKITTILCSLSTPVLLSQITPCKRKTVGSWTLLRCRTIKPRVWSVPKPRSPPVVSASASGIESMAQSKDDCICDNRIWSTTIPPSCTAYVEIKTSTGKKPSSSEEQSAIIDSFSKRSSPAFSPVPITLPSTTSRPTKVNDRKENRTASDLVSLFFRQLSNATLLRLRIGRSLWLCQRSIRQLQLDSSERINQ